MLQMIYFILTLKPNEKDVTEQILFYVLELKYSCLSQVMWIEISVHQKGQVTDTQTFPQAVGEILGSWVS